MAAGHEHEATDNRRIPVATYRLQFNHAFTFADARAILPYLAALGASDLYASPLLKAAAGSMHGYDIVDHAQINPEIGGADGFAALVGDMRRQGLRLLLDIVPNHMGITEENGWWRDVLENGPSSQYAPFFDIDWQPPRPEMANKVLLPILGDQFGRVLEQGELTLAYADGGFIVRYWEHTLPISPSSYDAILQPALANAEQTLPPNAEPLIELQSILTAVSHLPPQTATDPESVAELAREKAVIRRRLSALYDTDDTLRGAIDAAVAAFAGTPGEPASWDALAALLDRQAYRLSFWRVATEEINYRRFFDVNGLAALRMERSDVFEATHALVLLLVAAHAVAGLRIDHPDGLRDPADYLRRLQRRAGEALAGRELPPVTLLPPAIAPPAEQQSSPAPDTAARHPLYVVVEKILGHGERLPPDWPVDGATGYEYLNTLNGVFVDAANRKPFDALYAAFIGRRVAFRDLLYETKKQVMRSVLASEVNLLGQQLTRVAARHRAYRDFTRNALTTALIEVIAAFPIYRTYIVPGEGGVSERDRLYVQIAVDRARRRNPTADQSVYAFIQDTLTFEGYSTENDGPQDDQVDFVLKFQQVSSPVMAKSLEDTSFYVYTRLVSLNEVGGDPDQFGVSPSAFHRANAERGQRWPGSLLALSTHDTKRSEDVRARINVLSELPREWRAAIRRWSALNRRHKRTVRARERFPDRNAEYLLYQTLLGAWPLELLDTTRNDMALHKQFVERIHAYMEKAVREAKVYTSWIAQNAEYEDALHAFITGALDRPRSNPFVQEALPFLRRIAEFGLLNSLAQTLIKLTSPGVPDTYQGTELWDFSLVDPDNRRPVDFAARAALLDDLRARLRSGEPAALAEELLAARHDGRIKLLLTHCALQFRAGRPALYGPDGGYQPLDVAGAHAESVIAFQRSGGGAAALTVAPRLITRVSADGAPPLGDAWADSALLVRDPAGTRYRDAITGAESVATEREGTAALPLAEIFRTLPFALLERLSA